MADLANQLLDQRFDTDDTVANLMALLDRP
jgi:hypothetical protein